MKIVNFIKNLWKLLTIDPDKFSKIVENIDTVYVLSSAISQVSKIQDLHNEVIQQIAINQYGMSTTQGEIAQKISEIESGTRKKGKDIKPATQITLKDIFHKDDDDDIFH
jgi:hypothetical protein